MDKLFKEQVQKYLIHHSLKPYKDLNHLFTELSAVQIDPVNLVAPNHHLVISNRIDSYVSNDLETFLSEKKIIEVMAKERCFVPVEDFNLYSDRFLKFKEYKKEFFIENKLLINKVLDQIRIEGALCPKDFEGNSLGSKEIWSHRKDTTQILDYLWWAGLITVTKRIGNNKYYDLIENFIPEEIFTSKLSPELKIEKRILKYISSIKLTDINDNRLGFTTLSGVERKFWINKLIDEKKIKLIEIEDTKKKYICEYNFLIDYDDSITIEPSLLPPLDNFLWRRERLEDIFNFYYRWEIYTPQHLRKVGPYGMVLVDANGIHGQADIRFDRKINRLYINPFVKNNKKTDKVLESAILKLKEFLGFDTYEIIKSL